MPRRPADLDSISRADMEGDGTPPEDEGRSTATATAAPPRQHLAPVVPPPPATEPAVPVRVKPEKVPSIPGLSYTEFLMRSMAALMSSPLGMGAFSSKTLLTEAPRGYRKLAYMAERGPLGDYEPLPDAKKCEELGWRPPEK